MRRLLSIAAVVVLSSCLRAPWPRPAPIEEDSSIAFPNFYEREATRVGAEDRPYELDGATLQALAVAANDFLPPDARGRSCWNRQESYLYRAIKQNGLIFIDISADPDACQPGPRMLDGGARYAISLDGRVLRRLFDGEPETLSVPEVTDAGASSSSPVPTSRVGDTTGGEPQPLPSRWRDGGM